MAEEIDQIDLSASEVIKTLRTQADRASAFGFGRRIIVPPDEIHIVVGEGRHVWAVDKRPNGTEYGLAAEQPPHYWLNALTQVIKLKTTAFNIKLHGPNQQGLELLDKNHISFLVWVTVSIKLNPYTAAIAAQRVGNDLEQLIQTIKEVSQAELRSVAVTLSLEDIINDSTLLAYKAAENIQRMLKELGYDIVLLSITRIGGEAYQNMMND